MDIRSNFKNDFKNEQNDEIISRFNHTCCYSPQLAIDCMYRCKIFLQIYCTMRLNISNKCKLNYLENILLYSIK